MQVTFTSVGENSYQADLTLSSRDSSGIYNNYGVVIRFDPTKGSLVLPNPEDTNNFYGLGSNFSLQSYINVSNLEVGELRAVGISLTPIDAATRIGSLSFREVSSDFFISLDEIFVGFDSTAIVDTSEEKIYYVDGSTDSESANSHEFIAKSGNETFYGFTGKLNVVRQSGDLSSFTIQKIGNNFVLNDNNGSGGTDTLVDIERCIFDDKALAFDKDGAASAGGIYRLYKATFNREPDHGGLGYWIAQADSKTKDAARMAEDFTWSAEFQSLYNITTRDNYGTGTNVGNLVTGFYENVLGRPPDQGGLDFYTGVIDSKERTVGRVLAEISDSPENYNGTIQLIANGIVYDPWVG
jgi:hypothetical protein